MKKYFFVCMNADKNFKKLLKEYITFKHFLLLITPLSIAILIIMLFNLSRTVEHLSQSLIQRTSNKAHQELSNFFDPVRRNIFVAREWGDFRVYDNPEPENLNPKFIPILNNFPQVTCMLVANTNGSEYMLLQDDTCWYNRRTEFIGDKSHCIHSQFLYKHNKIKICSTWVDNKDYDPRTRPWFKGAIDNQDINEPAWTKPYIFFTTKEPGITVSTKWESDNDSLTYVLAYDILLMNISKFTSSLKVSENGKAFVFTDDGKMIGLPIDDTFTTIDSLKKYVLNDINDLNINCLKDAIAEWNTQDRKCEEPFHFTSGKEDWWCGIKIFELNSDTHFYIGVVVPEADFLSEMNKTKIIITTGFLLVLILTLLVIRGYNQKRKANHILAQKNEEIACQKNQIEAHQKEIKDSINYSFRIQKAILPPKELLSELLPENFILYKPKDIVSGDFYWIHDCAEKIMFCAADCTGHGVPGAFMSIISNNALNRAVREYKHNNPDNILNTTNDIIAETLRRNNSVKDGMDIALCSLHKTDRTLEYAGAYNPLYIIRKGTTPLISNNREQECLISNEEWYLYEIKATKKPIGNSDSDLKFTNNILSLQKDDLIIIFSDGYADQFGGPNCKKFRYKPFKKLLLSLADTEMHIIHSVLDTTFENWKGSENQVDDVIVFGVRV